MTHEPPSSSREPVRLRVLGPLDVEQPGGTAGGAAPRQPKRLALLAYLAVGGRRGFRRRDEVVALFWPESDGPRARNALSQALHQIRRGLGSGVLSQRGAEEISVDPGALWCDVVAFEDALADGRDEAALALYRGDFLSGVFVTDAAPELDQWIEGERSRLRAAALAAAGRLAEEAEVQGRRATALAFARRAMELSPGDEGPLRRTLLLMARMGDRVSALTLHDEYVRRLETEYGLDPDEETEELVAEIRDGLHGDAPATLPLPLPSASPAVLAPAPGPEAAAVPEAPPPATEPGPAPAPVVEVRSPRPFPRLRLLAPWGLAAAAVAAAILFFALRPPSDAPRVVAVGAVELGDAERDLAGLRDLLSAGLARVPGLEVVGTHRLEELRARTEGDPAASGDLSWAARAAGAEEILEGRLTRRAGGTLRLDLHRRDLATGRLREAPAVEASDPFDLVDLAVELLARDMGVAPPVRRTAGTSRSLPAYRLYEEGLRAYYAMDVTGAGRLFRAAVAEDTTFAMAAYYASLTADTPERWDLMERAVRLSDRASDREQLLIRTIHASYMQDPEVVRMARELVSRYPAEPDGHFQLGRALMWLGDFAGAVPHLRRVLQMDSLEVPGSQPRCRSCEAYETLGLAYYFQDQPEAMEVVARSRVAAQPDTPGAWFQLATVLEFRGRFDEAESALETAESLRPGLDLTPFRTSILTRRGEFADVESVLLPLLSSGNPDDRLGALWGLTINRRQQGRLASALEAALQYRRETTGNSPELLEAVVRFEMGEYTLAAELFTAIADRAVTGRSASLDGRQRAWSLVHVATAVAAMGDTARLAELEDSIRIQGGRSAYGRDRRLHYHVRGLRLGLQGRWEEAVAAYREALFSPVEGYARTNLELARALMQVGRPEEALELARAALRGPVGASGLYATRADFQELAGRAFGLLGQPDSAAVQFDHVLAAWKGADPLLSERARDVARRREVGGSQPDRHADALQRPAGLPVPPEPTPTAPATERPSDLEARRPGQSAATTPRLSLRSTAPTRSASMPGWTSGRYSISTSARSMGAYVETSDHGW